MDTEPLQHLTEQSAGVGKWMLKVVHEPREIDYTWSKGSVSGTGRKLEYNLVSDDSSQYCEGIYKKVGKEPNATKNFEQAKNKFSRGTVWEVSKVSLAKQNPKYLGCSCKVLIDMNRSTFQPVLQSTAKMPPQATPPEDLATLLSCDEGQVVDVIALVTNISPAQQKMTAYGVRDLVDVTIMDDSGTSGAASCKFPGWFPKTLTGPPCEQLVILNEAAAQQKPVAFFNLFVQKEDKAVGASEHGDENKKNTLKTSRDKFYFQICECSARAERLKNNAVAITTTASDKITVVAEMPNNEFGPYFAKTDIDYLHTEATFTVCRLLDYTINGGSSLLTPNTTDTTLFQINHARVLEPKANENVYTNAGDRLFPTARVIDHSGAFTTKMREKAALELSGQSNKEEFADLVSKGALNFPILCSLRIAVRKNSKSGDTTEDRLDAVIVEATQQDLWPQAMPNASMEFLSQLMLTLPADLGRMVAAPISAVRHVRHTGMVVEWSSSMRLQASCVLSLVAHTGRSTMKALPGGTKLISKGGWNVPFQEVTTQDTGAPEHADKKIPGELASYCTNENVQDYTLTGPNPKEPVYAMIIISGVQETSGENTFMVDKVNTRIVNKDNIPTIRSLLRKLARIPATPEVQGKANKSPEWLQDKTPYTAKKARRLSASPTDEDIPSPNELLSPVHRTK